MYYFLYISSSLLTPIQHGNVLQRYKDFPNKQRKYYKSSEKLAKIHFFDIFSTIFLKNGLLFFLSSPYMLVRFLGSVIHRRPSLPLHQMYNFLRCIYYWWQGVAGFGRQWCSIRVADRSFS